MRDSTNEMYKAFMAFFNSPLAMFDTPAQLEKVNMDYLDYYRNLMIAKNEGVTKGSVKEDIQKFKEKYGKEDASIEMQLKKDGYKRSVGLFFIENVGTYIFEGIKETIHDLKAHSLKGQESADLFVSFVNGYIPSYGTKQIRQTHRPQNHRKGLDERICQRVRQSR